MIKAALGFLGAEFFNGHDEGVKHSLVIWLILILFSELKAGVFEMAMLFNLFYYFQSGQIGGKFEVFRYGFWGDEGRC